MAPRKTTSKVSANAGVGKNTRSAIKKRAAAQSSTTVDSQPAPAFKLKATASASASKPVPEGLEVIERNRTTTMPKSSSTGLEVIQKKTSSKTSLLKDPTITKASLRSKAAKIPTSSPAKSSDSDPDPVAQRKLAAFHEARVLSFDQLHVQSDDFDNEANHSDSSEKQTPQKNPKKAIEASSASSKKMPNPTDETKVVSQRITRKRARENDDHELSQDSPVGSTAKKLTMKGPKGGPSTSVEKDSSKFNATLASAKRLKINPGAAPVSVTPAPAPVPATSGSVKAMSEGGPVITKNGKVKKTPEYAVEHAFIGTPSNHGSSLERPEFASLAQPWCCANLTCSTGMTWVPRDHKDPVTGKGPMGRKVISQFFGRNKGPTRLIPNNVWHYFCRKDYQRSRYAAEHGTPTELATQVIGNLRDQLIRLKLWRPDALFQVQLDKGATDRLNKYLALLRQHGNNEATAAAALPAAKDPKKVKPEEAFPCALSEVFNQRFATPGKEAIATYDDIENLITWSEAEINVGNSTVFVPAEFLINPIQPDETVNDVSNNFADWEVIRAALIAGTVAHTGAGAGATSRDTTSAPAPRASKSSKTVVNDPDETEVEGSDVVDDDDSEPLTPTPAPRLRTDPNNQMSIMHILNDVAEELGYHARRSRSASN